MDLTIINKELRLDAVPETAKFLIQRIVDGEVDALQADYYLKCLEELINRVRKNKDVQPLVLAEAEKYKGQSYNDAFPKVKERATAIINDTKLNELKDQVKARENMLKNLSESVVDPETGEELQPPTFKVTQFISWEK